MLFLSISFPLLIWVQFLTILSNSDVSNAYRQQKKTFRLPWREKSFYCFCSSFGRDGKSRRTASLPQQQHHKKEKKHLIELLSLLKSVLISEFPLKRLFFSNLIQFHTFRFPQSFECLQTFFNIYLRNLKQTIEQKLNLWLNPMKIVGREGKFSWSEVVLEKISFNVQQGNFEKH